MGNCLVHQDNIIKIMKMDGKILEYQSPLKVHQVLSEFTGHAISDTLPVHRHLCPEMDLLQGHLYYLLPPPLPSKETIKSTMTVSNNTKEGGKQSNGGVRIKIVITKQELKEMLAKGGLSINDMVSQLQNKKSKDEVDINGNCKGWKPLLQSIPE
ncbi:hypothetical protein AQUCO_07200126v1 [Aquilegia coerulea]|uniref:Uncharacterized protein n=1 Tax=Aquilegia coerulea TaxID=218851 RepID=A0A2G5CBM2_AQUCA|nr:hypothetical protein AQUCO_07200126v1 [Aquilegia coerulea]